MSMLFFVSYAEPPALVCVVAPDRNEAIGHANRRVRERTDGEVGEPVDIQVEDSRISRTRSAFSSRWSCRWAHDSRIGARN
jgi:hypothetical protein